MDETSSGISRPLGHEWLGAPLGLTNGGWSQILRFRRVLVVLAHLVLLSAAFWIAVMLRFDFDLPADYRRTFMLAFPMVIAIRMATFGGFGLFQGWWRHAGMHDLLSIAKAVTLSSLL